MNRATIAFLSLVLLSCKGEGGRPAPADLILTDGQVYTLDWSEPDRGREPRPGRSLRPRIGLAPRRRGGCDAGRARSFSSEPLPRRRPSGARHRGPGTERRHRHPGPHRVPRPSGATRRVPLPDRPGRTWIPRKRRFAWRRPWQPKRRPEHGSSDPVGTRALGPTDTPPWSCSPRRFRTTPSIFAGLHGFAGWGNRMAFELAGIGSDTPDPDGRAVGAGCRRRPERGPPEPGHPPPGGAHPDPHRWRRPWGTSWPDCRSWRSTATPPCTKPDRTVGTRRHSSGLEAEDRLPLRVYSMLAARDPELCEEWLRKGPDTDTESMLRTRSVKAFYDAALGSRGARMIEDYSDMPAIGG